MRIDLFLLERGYTKSRTEAKSLVEAGAVTVNGRLVVKPSFDVIGEEEISVDRSSIRFASRGGEKLDFALDAFKISVLDREALDIGASSGGFTDCLLQRGARHVIAVDSGSGQMSEVLAADSRVTVREGYNARYMKPSDLEYAPSLAVMDVSFISATYIIPSVFEVLRSGGDFVCLVKPQFEVGRALLGKGGIVKDAKAREGAVWRVVEFAKQIGFLHNGTVTSPIKGGDGNTEYLVHLVKC